MARRKRLLLPGHLCYLIQCTREPLCRNQQEQEFLLAVWHEYVRHYQLSLHAYALLDDGFHWVLTLPNVTKLAHLGLCMQRIARRYVAFVNRTSQRNGPLWQGRYHTALLAADDFLLAAQTLEQLAQKEANNRAVNVAAVCSSYAFHAGVAHAAEDQWLQPHPKYIQLANDPFARERAYRIQWSQVHKERSQQLLHAARHDWAFGSPAFLEKLALDTPVPLRPRPRGRRPTVPTET